MISSLAFVSLVAFNHTITCAALTHRDLHSMLGAASKSYHAVWCANTKTGELTGALLRRNGKLVGVISGYYEAEKECGILVFPSDPTQVVEDCPK